MISKKRRLVTDKILLPSLKKNTRFHLLVKYKEATLPFPGFLLTVYKVQLFQHKGLIFFILKLNFSLIYT